MANVLRVASFAALGAAAGGGVTFVVGVIAVELVPFLHGWIFVMILVTVRVPFGVLSGFGYGVYRATRHDRD